MFENAVFSTSQIIVLVPSLGILLFNNRLESERYIKRMFSSPLWGFFYLMIMNSIFATYSTKAFSSPLWGFFYLILNPAAIISAITVLVPSLGILLFNIYLQFNKNRHWFSSPLWGFFYLMRYEDNIEKLKKEVLVPSLGILLFNPVLENSDKHLAVLYVCGGNI